MSEQGLRGLGACRGSICITDTLASPGAFLIAHLLGESLRGGQGVVMVMVENAAGHYERVMRKLGVQTAPFVESGQLVVLDWLAPGALGIDATGGPSFEQLSAVLESKVASLMEGSRFQRCMVVIDCCTTLRSMARRQDDWVTFLRCCLSLDAVHETPVSFIALAHRDVPEDEPWVRWMRHQCDVTIDIDPVEKLSVAHMDGALVVTQQQHSPDEDVLRGCGARMEVSSQRLFYRVKDTRIQLSSTVDVRY
eukprot:evm.model.scf_1686EXC.2 EVM.evm.TU.scf_1686EXC.2   scf_1686EXC:28598-30943(+)